MPPRKLGSLRTRQGFYRPRKETFEKISTTRDAFIKEGVVKDVIIGEEIKYVVEVSYDANNVYDVICRSTYRFGGLFNYEEYINLGFTPDDPTKIDIKDMRLKAGDHVIVAFLYGSSVQGIILGFLKHGARIQPITENDEVCYRSEFNGIYTEINKNGEYTMIFKGLPLNFAKLIEQNGNNPLPKPVYNIKIGGAFWKFHKDGSFEINDGSLEDFQTFKIDKENGQIFIKSGDCYCLIEKATEVFTFVGKEMGLYMDEKLNVITKNFYLEATESVQIKTPKVAIGSTNVELLQTISDTLSALQKGLDGIKSGFSDIGSVSVTPGPISIDLLSGGGASSAASAASTASDKVDEGKNKIDSIKGTIS